MLDSTLNPTPGGSTELRREIPKGFFTEIMVLWPPFPLPLASPRGELTTSSYDLRWPPFPLPLASPVRGRGAVLVVSSELRGNRPARRGTWALAVASASAFGWASA